MIQEPDLVPFHVSHPQGDRALVLAPHPDDETLGCGGTIRLLLLKKVPIKIIFLTSGERADPSNPAARSRRHKNQGSDYSLMREKEAAQALSVLGVSDYEFFRFPDRELHVHHRDALDRLSHVVETFMPDTIYSPSVVELNPDHRATAALSLEILRRTADSDKRREVNLPLSIIFYEVTIPLRPNMLVDTTSVYTIKKKALKKYKSQMKIRNYLKYITALNEFRSLTVSGPKYIEAFWRIDNLSHGDEESAQWLSYNSPL